MCCADVGPGHKRDLKMAEKLNSIKEIIEFAIEREIDANKLYMYFANRIENASMRKLFEEFRPKMDGQFKEFSAAIEGILTAEQFKQWERDFKSKRGRRPGRFGPRRPGGPGGRPSGPGRPDGFHGPGPGGRSGPGGPDPNRRSGQRRGDYERYGSRQRGPTEPNAVDE